MSLDAQQLDDLKALYNLHADYLPPGPGRDVAMLGMMICCAASWARLRDMPTEWGWPRARKSCRGHPRPETDDPGARGG